MSKPRAEILNRLVRACIAARTPPLSTRSPGLFAMKVLHLLAFLLVLPFCTHAKNPEIDALVANLSGLFLWKDGAFVPMPLPATATPAQVAGRYMSDCRMTNYKILAVEDVWIPQPSLADKYTAVLLKTNLGEMIVLMRYTHVISDVKSLKETVSTTVKEPTQKTVIETHLKGGWWTMAFNVK
jgi:hypothetical protein